MTSDKTCCGKPMASFGDVQMLAVMNSEIETCYRWVCLECGSFYEVQEGQLDIENLVNCVNSFGSDTDKKQFVELHPELSDEVL
jgi:hypothetical protein